MMHLGSGLPVTQFSSLTWRPEGGEGSTAVSNDGDVLLVGPAATAAVLPAGSTSISQLVSLSTPTVSWPTISEDGNFVVGWTDGNTISMVSPTATATLASSPQFSPNECAFDLQFSGHAIVIIAENCS